MSDRAMVRQQLNESFDKVQVRVELGKILNNIKDHSTQNLLRDMIFSGDAGDLNWNVVAEMMIRWKPELTRTFKTFK